MRQAFSYCTWINFMWVSYCLIVVSCNLSDSWSALDNLEIDPWSDWAWKLQRFFKSSDTSGARKLENYFSFRFYFVDGVIAFYENEKTSLFGDWYWEEGVFAFFFKEKSVPSLEISKDLLTSSFVSRYEFWKLTLRLIGYPASGSRLIYSKIDTFCSFIVN